MNWGDVGKTLAGSGLKLLGGVLAGPAGSAVGGLVSSALGLSSEDPKEVEKALQSGGNVEKLRLLESQHRAELQRLAIESETATLLQTAKTMRAEIKSEDWMVRRGRPFHLWITGISTLVFVLLAVVIFLWHKEEIDGFNAMLTAIMPILGFSYAVCGVYVRQRTVDKGINAGHPPQPTLMGAIAERIRK